MYLGCSLVDSWDLLVRLDSLLRYNSVELAGYVLYVVQAPIRMMVKVKSQLRCDSIYTTNFNSFYVQCGIIILHLPPLLGISKLPHVSTYAQRHFCV